MNCHWCQGQSCSSTTRLFLHESIHDEVVEKLGLRRSASGTRWIRIDTNGMPDLERNTTSDELRIELGKQEGARLTSRWGGANLRDVF